MSNDGRARVASVSDVASAIAASDGVCAAGTSRLRNKIIPFARLADVQDAEPVDRKCLDCQGAGTITVFSVTTGEQLCTVTCPTCGGTRYAP